MPSKVDQSVKDITDKPEDTDDFEQDLVELVQKNHQRDPNTNPYIEGNPYTAEFAFHFTATWKDVQAKAKRIHNDGHVRVISTSPAYLVGEVRGDTDIYQTTLAREPGSQRVAMWECGCAWASYSWGRSGRWKKYEGRMCSHALALNYEGQSRGWGGQEITEDTKMPAWRSDPSITVKVPGDYKRPAIRDDWRRDSVKRVAYNNTPPSDEVARYLLDAGGSPSEVLAVLRDFGVLTAPSVLNRVMGAPRTAAHVTQCDSCGAAVLDEDSDFNEWFMLKNDVWTQSGAGNSDILCVGCVEDRLGRELTKADFDPDLGVNWWEAEDRYAFSWRSERLKDRLSRTAKTAQADDQDGCMVAIRPPREVLDYIHVEDGEDYENLHVTLAYLGKAAEVDEELLIEVVSMWAEHTDRLEGQLSGYGLFENGDERVLYASVDTPGLNSARAELVELLVAAGLPVSMEHDFTPHLTLAYGEFDFPEALSEEAKRVFRFPEVYVAAGPDWLPIPFRASVEGPEQRAAKVAAPTSWMPLNDAQYSELVSTDALEKWVEVDRMAENPERVKMLAADIAERGFTDPVIIEIRPYEHDEEMRSRYAKALLIEGNHRWAVAKMLGIPVPAKVLPVDYPWSPRFGNKPKDVELIAPFVEIWQGPGFKKPSEVFAAGQVWASKTAGVGWQEAKDFLHKAKVWADEHGYYLPGEDWKEYVNKVDEGMGGKWGVGVLQTIVGAVLGFVTQFPAAEELLNEVGPYLLSLGAKTASLQSSLEQLKGAFVEAAQSEYDSWDQSDGFMGGICDEIAARMGSIITEHIEGVSVLDGGQEGDDHAWLVVADHDEGVAWGVDIHPSNYETGGGYSWTKIEGVTFGPNMVEIFPVDYDLMSDNQEFEDFYTGSKTAQLEASPDNPYLGPKVKCMTGRCEFRLSMTTNANGICSRHPEGNANLGKAILWEREHGKEAAVTAGNPKTTCMECGAFMTPRVMGDGFWECRNCGADLWCDECGQTLPHSHKKDEPSKEDEEPPPTIAILHDEPEPALPTTEGDDGDDDDGDDDRAWIMAGGKGDYSNKDIAMAARAFLAVKDFTPAEQRVLIDEGEAEGVVASNLDLLDLEGTHYAPLEEAYQEMEVDDEDWFY